MLQQTEPSWCDKLKRRWRWHCVLYTDISVGGFWNFADGDLRRTYSFYGPLDRPLPLVCLPIL